MSKGRGGSQYGDVQCIMGNGHMGNYPLPCEQKDWQTHMTETITFVGDVASMP